MLKAVSDYEHGLAMPDRLEEIIEFNMQALEGISLSHIREARFLMHRLVTSHFANDLEEFIDVEGVTSILIELKVFLCGLKDPLSA